MNMIPHSHKFPLRTELLKFRARATKTTTPHLILSRSPAPTHSRLSIIVPKKVSKQATTRNYLKRLSYDALWTELKDQKIDMVVIFKPLPLNKTAATKQQLLAELHV